MTLETDAFTRGPWEAVKVNDEFQSFGIVAAHQPMTDNILDIAAIWKRGGNKKSAANARLIAAAPDLLIALRNLVSCVERDRTGAGILLPTEAAIATAKDAIVKARGE